MDIQEIRRARLREWLKDRAAPSKEKSYFSQLANGTSSFGERAARRIEREYGMGAGYLDTPPESSGVNEKASTAVPPYNEKKQSQAPSPLIYPANSPEKYRRIFVVGRGQGGLPDRIWTDGDYPVGATDQYGELASPDPHAFLVPVVGNSMVPRFNPGEFALVEPGTEPEIEDSVLVRLVTGETMIKRLLSRRAGIRLGSYNDVTVLTFSDDQVTWMYYIAHPVPARKIKIRM